MLVIVVLWASVCIQFISVYFALRLMKQIGGKLAWATLSAAIFLMAIRRSISLYHAMQDYPVISKSLDSEIVALIISICILIGVIAIAPLFKRLLGSEQKLTEQMQRNQIFLNSNPDAFMMTNINGQLKEVNQAFRNLFNQHYSSSITSFNELLAASQLKEFSEEWRKLLKEKQNRYIFNYKNGEQELKLELNAKLIEQNNEKFIYAFIQDVTQHENMEARLYKQKERAQVTLESIADGVITTDINGRIHFANIAAEKLLGKTNNDLKGVKLKSILCFDCGKFDQMSQPLHKLMKECIKQKKTLSFSNQYIRGNNLQEHCLDVIISPLQNREKITTGAVLVLRDVTELRQMEEELSYQITHDPLTSLINRSGFENRIAGLFESVKNTKKQHALFNICLDSAQFNLLVDSCGHDARDDVLKQVSALLKSLAGKNDSVTRVDNTNFRLLVESARADKVEQLAKQIIHKFIDSNFIWNKNQFTLNVCIGISILDNQVENISDILSQAESACHVAKEHGKNHFHIYSNEDDLSIQSHDYIKRLQQLQSAIDDNRFVLYKQPILDLDGKNSVHHCEVLIRMLSESNEIISPAKFLPVAEQYHLMPVIDRWVVKETLFIIKDRAEDLAEESHFSINLSGQTLGDASFLDEVLVLFKETNVPYSKVCFEITETALISNFTNAQKFISSLRLRGCKFSLDDFGSGLSSFTYLKTLPVDYLKIDGSFIIGVLNDDKDYNLVKAIHQIGEFMGIQTVAEFIESQEVLDCIKDIGINYGQGYALGKPEVIVDDISVA